MTVIANEVKQSKNGLCKKSIGLIAKKALEMNKIILTQHVKERRKKGNIPEELLEQLGHHILGQHPMDTLIDGIYKFRKSGTCAVFGKRGNHYTFITLYGATGHLLSADEFGTFNCRYQDPEIVKAKAQKRVKKK